MLPLVCSDGRRHGHRHAHQLAPILLMPPDPERLLPDIDVPPIQAVDSLLRVAHAHAEPDVAPLRPHLKLRLKRPFHQPRALPHQLRSRRWPHLHPAPFHQRPLPAISTPPAQRFDSQHGSRRRGPRQINLSLGRNKPHPIETQRRSDRPHAHPCSLQRLRVLHRQRHHRSFPRCRRFPQPERNRRSRQLHPHRHRPSRWHRVLRLPQHRHRLRGHPHHPHPLLPRIKLNLHPAIQFPLHTPPHQQAPKLARLIQLDTPRQHPLIPHLRSHQAERPALHIHLFDPLVVPRPPASEVRPPRPRPLEHRRALDLRQITLMQRIRHIRTERQLRALPLVLADQSLQIRLRHLPLTRRRTAPHRQLIRPLDPRFRPFPRFLRQPFRERPRLREQKLVVEQHQRLRRDRRVLPLSQRLIDVAVVEHLQQRHQHRPLHERIDAPPVLLGRRRHAPPIPRPRRSRQHLATQVRKEAPPTPRRVQRPRDRQHRIANRLRLQPPQVLPPQPVIPGVDPHPLRLLGVR